MSNYQPPVSLLLALGEPGPGDWIDYLQMGFTPEHLPQLIEMAADDDLHEAQTVSPQVWAPLHAWRALGQLRAVDAVIPLLFILNKHGKEGDDWCLNDMPEVFSLIGPAAIPYLATFFQDPTQDQFARMTVVDALENIALGHEEACAPCVEILTHLLENADAYHTELNGALVDSLVNLKAIESAEVIAQAFALQKVDTSVCGDWDIVQYHLGLGPNPFEEEDLTKLPPPSGKFPNFLLLGEGLDHRTERAKAKAKRKESRKARKRNRNRR